MEFLVQITSAISVLTLATALVAAVSKPIYDGVKDVPAVNGARYYIPAIVNPVLRALVEMPTGLTTLQRFLPLLFLSSNFSIIDSMVSINRWIQSSKSDLLDVSDNFICNNECINH